MRGIPQDALPGFVIHKRTITITQADDLADLANGVTSLVKELGDNLPANARYLGHTIGEDSFTGFTDGDAATYVLKLGSESDDDSIVTTVNVAAGQTGFPKAGTLGVQAFLMCPLASEVYRATLTSSADLNTATAGSIEVHLFFANRA